jgi:hypothetical protein
VLFPWPGGRLERILIPLEVKKGAEITLHVRAANSDGDLASGNDVATVTRRIAAGTKGWVECIIGVDLPGPYAWIFMNPVKDANWLQSGVSRPGVARFFGREGNWQMVKESAMAFALDPDPLGLPATVYTPANVINGIARPWPGQSNVWMSSAAEKLPQWIELALDKPASVSAVHCVFDTELSIMLGKQSGLCPKGCVRDYRIEVRAGGEWRTVAREQMNFQRFRRHVFAPVVTDAVRLTVEAVERATQACVHESRVYSEILPFAAT